MKFFLALLGVFLFSCQSQEKTLEQGKTIYYYPVSNVYFDADNNHYLLLNQSGTWEVRENLLPEQTANLGQRVVVENPEVPVWKANSDHKMIYAASIYTAEADYRKKFIEDSLNSIPKKSVISNKDSTSEGSNEKKDKTKVGRFLDRLFGGKEKKNKSKDKEKEQEEDS